MKTAVAMSGGIDSSVAALLLHQQGHDLLGLTMQVWVEQPTACRPGKENTCCGEAHVNDARRVAAIIGFPHYNLDFREAFNEHVVTNFKSEYAAGRTPIPCIHCNKSLKFDILLQKVRQLGCEQLATGHYIKKEWDELRGQWRLYRSAELERDQSYFLYGLSQAQLAMLDFPVGTWEKSRLRAYAEAHHLPNHAKRDSFDLCFVPDGDYRAVLEASPDFQPLPGQMVDTRGRVLGEHGGIHRYTIGQRKGLGIAAPEPLYVVRLDAARRQVVVGTREELFSAGVWVHEVNWIAGEPPSEPFECRIETKLRSAHRGSEARIVEIDGSRVRLAFTQPERAVTTGQAAVFYRGEELLGGGWIREAVGE